MRKRKLTQAEHQQREENRRIAQQKYVLLSSFRVRVSHGGFYSDTLFASSPQTIREGTGKTKNNDGQ